MHERPTLFSNSTEGRSESAAAFNGRVGEVRFDPFAMRLFCGYNMADYFRHWFEMGHRRGARLPRIFHVNRFCKGSRATALDRRWTNRPAAASTATTAID